MMLLRNQHGSRAATRAAGGEPHQPALDAALALDHHTAGEPEVAVEPRVEQDAAVDLDAKLRVALGDVLGSGLSRRWGAVGCLDRRCRTACGARALRTPMATGCRGRVNYAGSSQANSPWGGVRAKVKVAGLSRRNSRNCAGRRRTIPPSWPGRPAYGLHLSPVAHGCVG